jgi:hypothetical protein
MIGFSTVEQARAYQMKNPESRIIAQGKQHNVWLPLLPSMKYIRGCSDGLAIGFASSETAAEWCNRLILGYVRNKIEVYIRREWEKDRLNEVLAFEASGQLKESTSGNTDHRGGPPPPPWWTSPPPWWGSQPPPPSGAALSGAGADDREEHQERRRRAINTRDVQVRIINPPGNSSPSRYARPPVNFSPVRHVRRSRR